MGTNFYLRMREPIAVYDEFHIAKTSYGWKPLFEAHHKGFDGDEEPDITSVADIRREYETGKYDIVDEYGDVYDWDGFEERVLRFDGDRHHEHAFVDDDGYEFFRYGSFF